MTSEIVLLLVEDEPLILLGMQDALESGGYTVVTAANGADALDLLESRQHELCGCITDIRLGPGPDGWDLGRRARELSPHMAIVYVTGDSAHDWAALGVPKSVVIQKPFADAQLVTAISALLTDMGPQN
jgi:CheY-like chemotaxis protein